MCDLVWADVCCIRYVAHFSDLSVNIKYFLPLGSDYLNRQSATFFIFRNHQEWYVRSPRGKFHLQWTKQQAGIDYALSH